jgi:hypothetical protein
LLRKSVHRLTMIAALSAPTPRLTTLNLSQNSIGALGLRLLVDGLGKNDTLTTLLLAMNQLDRGGASPHISFRCFAATNDFSRIAATWRSHAIYCWVREL